MTSLFVCISFEKITEIENSNGWNDTKHRSKGCMRTHLHSAVRLHWGETVVDCSSVFRTGRFLKHRYHSDRLRPTERVPVWRLCRNIAPTTYPCWLSAERHCSEVSWHCRSNGVGGFLIRHSFCPDSLRWRYKSLILFKLMLLQKKVVCFGSPVRPICALILSILSLHPKLLEDGFSQVACVRYVESGYFPFHWNLYQNEIFRFSTSRPMSPMPDFSESSANEKDKSIPVDENTTPEHLSTNLERKISISEQDSKSPEHGDKQQAERSLLPRDPSVDTLASTCGLCLTQSMTNNND